MIPMPTFYFNFGDGDPSPDGCEFQTVDEAKHAGVASLLAGAAENPAELLAGECVTVTIRDEFSCECSYSLALTKRAA